MSLMPRGDQLLLPANPLFNRLTLLLPLGRSPAVPDMLALTLAFWAVNQPRRVGVGVSFFFGLLMDVHQGSLLGQHGLAYSLLAFAAIALHRRMLWFPVLQQAMQVLPLLVAAHLVSLAVRMVAGDLFPGWTYFIAPCFEALLWPVVTFVYLAPQRRAPDPDENRPL
jgi:rod shape-determining protein MreD